MLWSTLHPSAPTAAPGSSQRQRTVIPVRIWNSTTSSSRLSRNDPASRSARPSRPGAGDPLLGEDGRRHHLAAHQHQRPQPPGQPPPEVGAVPAGDVPDVVHGVLEALGDPEAAPEGAEDADDQGQARALDGPDAALDLGPEHRELPGQGLDHVLLELGVVGQGVADHGDEHQQQREQAQQPVVGEQGGMPAAPVVAVLLDDPEGEPEHAVPLLEPVDRPQQAFDALHTALRSVPGQRNKAGRRRRRGMALLRY